MKHTKSIFVIYVCLPFHPLLVDRLVTLASCADVTSGKRLDSIHSWEVLTAYPAWKYSYSHLGCDPSTKHSKSGSYRRDQN